MLDLVGVKDLRRDPDLSRDRDWSSGDEVVVSGDVSAMSWTCGEPFVENLLIKKFVSIYAGVEYGTISLE